jgi:hypothetical protein
MSTPAEDVETAWRRFSERVNHFVDAVALDPDDDNQTEGLADVIVDEARMIAINGPAFYLGYLADMDALEAKWIGGPVLTLIDGGRP